MKNPLPKTVTRQLLKVEARHRHLRLNNSSSNNQAVKMLLRMVVLITVNLAVLVAALGRTTDSLGELAVAPGRTTDSLAVLEVVGRTTEVLVVLEVVGQTTEVLAAPVVDALRAAAHRAAIEAPAASVARLSKSLHDLTTSPSGQLRTSKTLFQNAMARSSTL